MLNALSQVNWLAVFICVVATFFLGGIWFALIVARLYALALGRESLPPAKPNATMMIGPAVCNLVSIVTSAVLIKWLALDSVASAVGFGLLVGFGYVASTCQTIAINPNFPRPFLYALINIPYFLIVHVLASFVLFQMG